MPYPKNRLALTDQSSGCPSSLCRLCSCSRGRRAVGVGDGCNTPARRALEAVVARCRAPADCRWGDRGAVTTARKDDVR